MYIGEDRRKNQEKFVEKQKKIYKKLKPCFCIAIQETVYFTSDGLNHLLFKKRRPRNISERVYRMQLVIYLRRAIKNTTKAIKKTYLNPSSYLWVLDWVEIPTRKDKFIIKVILRKVGKGRIHFFSVMRKKNNHYKSKRPSK